MPTKTYYKPNRTKPRLFKVCDAARIAREVVRDDPETTPEEVLACIAKGFGFTHISLSRPRVVAGSLLPTVVRNLPAIIEKLTELIVILIKRYGWLAPFFKDIVDALDKLRKIIDALTKDDPPQSPVDEVINSEKCNCKKTETKLLDKPGT